MIRYSSDTIGTEISLKLTKYQTVSVIQSNYIPWLGYFAIAAASDVFVVYEDVQYTKNDWRNRNQIEIQGTRIWLTVPVHHEYLGQNFIDVKVAHNKWPRKHFQTLRNAFLRKTGWRCFNEEIEHLYLRAESCQYLFQVNRLFLDWAFKTLRINAQVVYLDSYPHGDGPTDRLVSILRTQGATRYISGPSAESYIDDRQFVDADIRLEYADYDRLIPQVFDVRNGYTTVSLMQYLLGDK